MPKKTIVAASVCISFGRITALPFAANAHDATGSDGTRRLEEQPLSQLRAMILRTDLGELDLQATAFGARQSHGLSVRQGLWPSRALASAES